MYQTKPLHWDKIKRMNTDMKNPYAFPGCGIKLQTLKILVSEAYNIDLTADNRTRDVAYPRQIYFYLAKKHVTPTPGLTEIGSIVGNRDHATVLSGIRRVEAHIKIYPKFRLEVQKLEQTLLQQIKA